MIFNYMIFDFEMFFDFEELIIVFMYYINNENLIDVFIF